MVARDKMDVELKSSRAPYTRGGIRFASNRTPVTVPGDEITDDQLEALAGDAAISIALVNRETGERQEFAKLTAEQNAPVDAAPTQTPPAAAPKKATGKGSASTKGGDA
jgi:hypothetical protein